MTDKKQYTFELEASPYSWMLYAQELHESANIIIGHSGFEINQFPSLNTRSTLQNAFFLNFGFSVENLLKATLIAEDANRINDFRLDPKMTKGHDLLNLVKEVKSIKLDKDEKGFLKILSDAIPNWGRYPVPLTADKILSKTEYSVEIHACLERIWNKLIMNLYSLIKDGDWVSPLGIRTGYFRDSTLESDMNAVTKELNQKGAEWLSSRSGNVEISKTIYYEK